MVTKIIEPVDKCEKMKQNVTYYNWISRITSLDKVCTSILQIQCEIKGTAT